MDRCLHENFETGVDIARTYEKEGMPVSHYSATIKIRCKDCKIEFRFLGDHCGVDWKNPTIGLMGHELRAPMHPDDGTIPLPPKIKGFSVSTSNVEPSSKGKK